MTQGLFWVDMRMDPLRESVGPLSSLFISIQASLAIFFLNQCTWILQISFFLVKLNAFPHFLDLRITWHNQTFFHFVRIFPTFAFGKSTTSSCLFFFLMFLKYFINHDCSYIIFFTLIIVSGYLAKIYHLIKWNGLPSHLTVFTGSIKSVFHIADQMIIFLSFTSRSSTRCS